MSDPMSLRVMAWAWEQPTHSSGERLVLLALADHAGDDGECWPSSGRIAQKTGLDPGSVRRHIDHLAERGLVEKVERRRHPDGTLGTWTLRVGQRAPVSTGQPVPMDTGARTSAHRCTPPARTGARAEPSLRTVIEPSVSQSSNAFESVVSEVVDGLIERFPSKGNNPQNHRKAIETDVIAKKGDQITELIRIYPDAIPAVIALDVLRDLA